MTKTGSDTLWTHGVIATQGAQLDPNCPGNVYRHSASSHPPKPKPNPSLPGCACCRGCSPRPPHKTSRPRPSWVSTSASRRSRNLKHAAAQESRQELQTVGGDRTRLRTLTSWSPTLQFSVLLSDSQLVVPKSPILSSTLQPQIRGLQIFDSVPLPNSQFVVFHWLGTPPS